MSSQVDISLPYCFAKYSPAQQGRSVCVEVGFNHLFGDDSMNESVYPVVLGVKLLLFSNPLGLCMVKVV